MDVLWSAPAPLSVREVLDRLTGRRSLAYTTVMTVLDNLHRKGFLRRRMEGRAYFYEPVQSREQYAAKLMGVALAGSGDRGATLAHFLEQMPARDATLLKDALRRRSSGS